MVEISGTTTKVAKAKAAKEGVQARAEAGEKGKVNEATVKEKGKAGMIPLLGRRTQAAAFVTSSLVLQAAKLLALPRDATTWLHSSSSYS